MSRRFVVADFAAFRALARALVTQGVPPSELEWVPEEERQSALFAEPSAPPSGTGEAFNVSRDFLAKAEAASLNRDPQRWNLIYRVLWRLHREQPHLLSLAADPDVRRLELLAKEAQTDEHRVHAFARFRKIEAHGEERYVAWHRPDHHVLRRAAQFFRRRFGQMHWSLLTPDESAHWDGTGLTFGPGVPRSAAPSEDEMETLWRTYYASTFNPARLNLKAMTRDLPTRYMATMPEMGLVARLVADAPARTREMTQQTWVTPSYLPEDRSLRSLRSAVQTCTACPLYEHATQAVFGEGPADARAVLVGEQPGDSEDLHGRPFIGPAGKVLDGALDAAGLERSALYLTNAVKHFKWRPSEREKKRRIHEKPGGNEIRACKGWLLSELEALEPEFIVCLGATAASALFGTGFRLNHSRGKVFSLPGYKSVLATWHPSAVLRMPNAAAQEKMRSELIADLHLLAAALAA